MTAPLASAASFDSFRAELTRLVDRFDRQHPTFTSPDYNEATLRADFLDPFFRALGWDVGNQKGLIHTEREVDIEVRTAVSGRQTRADYVFRVARTDRFTCEAKKPAEALHDRHIFQAKRDAFNRGIPLALLSDFEELKIFVVGARPILDEPHTGEWKVLHFRQYPDAARDLWDLLAYENVAAGSVDRLIDSLPKRPLKLKGRQGYLIKPDRTRALDSDFLNFLDGVRQQLGSDLLKHNDRADLLTGHRLNEAAQRIIDRLVFLRICEDRGIDTGTLLETLFRDWFRQQPESRQPKLRKVSHQTNLRFSSAADEDPGAYADAARQPAEGGLYRELTEHIRALDQRPPSYKPFFNGQLFKPHFSEDLVVGDEWLANFILDLTSDDSGYNFADIKVEILGDAYERFLGHILVPKGRGTAIEEKPEVRKAGGVYYTPRYITDYIVEQTIGRLLDGKTPKEVEKLRFLDPACGSGSFLIRAYERVMEHYLRYFTANPEKRRKDDCFVDAAGNVRLTTALKRRILENNIYGVDIDAQAVEVTQLSLYLKMLEGENRDTLRQQTELFRGEPLLPPLDKNIKCFNSLIGSDFSLDPAELIRINAGDWDIHFETIIKAGGFDAVIGNPPYVQIENIEPANRRYYVETYGESGKLGKRYDLYQVFVMRGIKLLREGGFFGNILPNTFLMGHSYTLLRKRLCLTNCLLEIVDLPQGVFQGVTIDNVLLFFSRAKAVKTSHVSNIAINKLGPKSEKARVSTRNWDEAFVLKQSDLTEANSWKINVHTNPRQAQLFSKIETGGWILGDETDSTQGIILYRTEKDAKLGRYTSNEKRAGWKRLLRGKNIARYETLWGGEYVSYGDWLWCAREERFFLSPKILLHAMRNKSLPRRLVATYDDAEHYNAHNLANIISRHSSAISLKFVLGIFNSTLINYWYRSHFPNVNINPSDFRQIPLPASVRDSTDKQHHDRLVALVDKMLTLTPALRAAKSEAEKATLQNAVKKTDREIDQLVYQLYALTPEEIALVEGPAVTASIDATE